MTTCRNLRDRNKCVINDLLDHCCRWTVHLGCGENSARVWNYSSVGGYMAARTPVRVARRHCGTSEIPRANGVRGSGRHARARSSAAAVVLFAAAAVSRVGTEVVSVRRITGGGGVILRKRVKTVRFPRDERRRLRFRRDEKPTASLDWSLSLRSGECRRDESVPSADGRVSTPLGGGRGGFSRLLPGPRETKDVMVFVGRFSVAKRFNLPFPAPPPPRFYSNADFQTGSPRGALSPDTATVCSPI